MTAKEKVITIQGILGVVQDGDFKAKSRAALEALLLEAARPAGVPEPVKPGTQFDERTERNLATLDPKAAAVFRPFLREAKEIAASMGCEYVVISGNRTWAEQDALYAQGRGGNPGKIVTNAKGGSSNHNFGVAIDIGVFRDGKYLDEKEPKTADKIHSAVGKIVGEFGIEWGGNWKSIVDRPHFQVVTNLSPAQMRDRYKKDGSVL